MGVRKGRLRFQDLTAVDFLDSKDVRRVYNEQKARIAALEAENRVVNAKWQTVRNHYIGHLTSALKEARMSGAVELVEQFEKEAVAALSRDKGAK